MDTSAPPAGPSSRSSGTASGPVQPADSDPRYQIDGLFDFLAQVRARFQQALQGGQPLFLTAVGKELWPLYLDAVPDGLRQKLRCTACQKFIERYGSLVRIDEAGHVTSVLWPEDAQELYAQASRRLRRAVEDAPVKSVFLSSHAVLGKPVTGLWRHLAVELPPTRLWTSVVKTAGQARAEVREERDMLQRGLADFSVDAVRKAHGFLTSGALYRSEKCEGVAAWLLDLHERLAAEKHESRRQNLLWRAAALAPAGYCHVRGGMIGTLLEDVVADLPFDAIKARFDAKMSPLQYMRPQAAPSAGNIAQAEKIVGALKTAGALARRFAKLSDVQCLWRPTTAGVPDATTGADPSPRSAGGIFSHLRSAQDAGPPESDAPPTVMTWVKFAATVLPKAEAIEFWVPSGKDAYMAMVTAQNPEAPPILQWDSETQRNPVSWYLYVNGSTPQNWNLVPNEFHRVSAVVLQPTLWDPNRQFPHQGASVCFVLDGSRDVGYRDSAGFFPEWLRSEYHPVRATLEAYAKSAVVAGKDEAEVCGIRLTKGMTWNQIFRVTSRGLRTRYKLDRWD